MSIDLSRETLLTLGEAARRLPRRRLGRQVSPSTLWRWHARGVRSGNGRLYLEALDTPSGLVTSTEALQRFLNALSSGGNSAASSPRSAASRLNGLEGADIEAELTAKGV